MSYREMNMIEVLEVLPRWTAGQPCAQSRAKREWIEKQLAAKSTPPCSAG